MPDELRMISDKEFHVRCLGEIGAATAQHDYATAWALIERVMNEVSPEKQAHCFLLRGEIKNYQGKPDEARHEWFEGIPLSRPGSFGRLTIEYELGKSFEIEGQKEDALNYYLSAIKTCAEGEKFSGCQPLAAYLALNEGHIPQEYHDTVAMAVEKSWEVLEVPGRPDLDDLPNAINVLSEHLANLINQAQGE